MSGTVHRFFVAPRTLAGRERLPLPGELEHQVRRVLRLRDGAEIVLLEGDGDEVSCVIAGGELMVTERRRSTGEPRHRLTVVQALLKGDALEQVVQHATEIGVARFRLIVTARCVAREISPRTLDRLRSIAREAAEQSERGVVPAVEAPIPLSEALTASAVVLYERHHGASLGSIEPPEAIVIGPEGGFSPAEILAAEAAGAPIVGLGPRILRSQTVAVAAAALILSRTGDFA